MKLSSVLVAGFICIFSPLFADSPAPPVAYVTAASPGFAYFRMVPRPYDESGHLNGFGIAYRVGPDGADEELWRTEGWYSSEVFLSFDGQYLVAMGPWSSGHEPKNEDLAVSFYRNGKLLKQYSTADLVKDKTKVSASVSHYRWLARDVDSSALRNRAADPALVESQLRVSWDNIFYLKTCDGILYQFDMTTGEIKKAISRKSSGALFIPVW
jgi:hypothetical protein